MVSVFATSQHVTEFGKIHELQGYKHNGVKRLYRHYAIAHAKTTVS